MSKHQEITKRFPRSKLTEFAFTVGLKPMEWTDGTNGTHSCSVHRFTGERIAGIWYTSSSTGSSADDSGAQSWAICTAAEKIEKRHGPEKPLVDMPTRWIDFKRRPTKKRKKEKEKGTWRKKKEEKKTVDCKHQENAPEHKEYCIVATTLHSCSQQCQATRAFQYTRNRGKTHKHSLLYLQYCTVCWKCIYLRA